MIGYDFDSDSEADEGDYAAYWASLDYDVDGDALSMEVGFPGEDYDGETLVDGEEDDDCADVASRLRRFNIEPDVQTEEEEEDNWAARALREFEASQRT